MQDLHSIFLIANFEEMGYSVTIREEKDVKI